MSSNLTASAKLLLVLLLSGCSYVSEFQRPTPPIPGNWPLAASAAQPQATAKIHWQSFFPDPRLQTLIAAALEHNRDMRIAVARVAEARAQYGITRADRFPNISLQATANNSGVGDAPPNTSSTLSVPSVTYEADFWGRLASLSEASRLSYLATEEARRAFQISLVANVASAYFNLLQMEDLCDLARNTMHLRAQTLDIVTKGRDLGGVYDFELQQASTALESARANLASLAHQRSMASNQLNFLVGETPDALPLGKTLDEQGLEAELAPGLPSEVLLLRPDIIAAENRLMAAHANIDAARAAFWPRISLTASMGMASQLLNGVFSSGGAWAFQPVLSLPLFDGGRLSSAQDLAEARKVIAVAEYEKAIQLAFREVADLLSARASYAAQMRSAKANVQSQNKRLEISQARYDTGLISYLDLLDVQRELITAQQTMIQVRRAQLEVASQLYKALGGGEQTSAAGAAGDSPKTPEPDHS